MRLVFVASWFGLCLGLVVLACAGPVRADDKAGGHAAHPPVTKYQVTVHQDGKEVTKKLDASKEADAREITELLRKGEVGHLKPDKPTNILEIRWDLGLWTLVVFVLLLLILRRAAWGPMLEGLKRRESSIRGAIEEAQRTRDEASRLRDQFQRDVDKTHETVRDMLDEARRDAQHTKDEMLAAARADIQTERDRLRREIEMARDQALHEIWNQTARLATLVSAKAIRRELNQDDHRRLVDEAVAELRDASAEPKRQVASIRT